MQRTKPAPRKVSIAMRRSMLQLEQKARWLRPVGGSLPEAVIQPPKRSRAIARRPTRTFSTILKEYKETLERLENIEHEMAEWLNDPLTAASGAQPSYGVPIPGASPGSPAPEGEVVNVAEMRGPATLEGS